MYRPARPNVTANVTMSVPHEAVDSQYYLITWFSNSYFFSLFDTSVVFKDFLTHATGN